MLKGKRGIIFGVANDHSIAWGISKKLSEHGAELALTYQNDTLLKRIKPLSKEINSKLLIECDFSQSNSIKKCFDSLNQEWNNIDPIRVYLLVVLIFYYHRRRFPVFFLRIN